MKIVYKHILRKIIIIAALVFCFVFQSQGQCTYTSLSNQTDIDAFPVDNPDCSEVSTLYVWGNSVFHMDSLYIINSITEDLIIAAQKLTDLSGLDNVTMIPGDVDIRPDSLTSLEGLNGLTEIQGNLLLQGLPSLESITALSNLTSIGGNLIIENALSLTSLDGLESLTQIGGNLVIINAPALQNIEGLASLTSIGEDFVIIKADNLTNLSGLENLTQVGGNLLWEELDNLSSIEGIANLNTIGGNFEIDNAETLPSLTGLSSLTQVEGYFRINNIPNLTDVAGISNLQNVSGILTLSNLDSITHFGWNVNFSTLGGLAIRDCRTLRTLDGLQSLQGVDGNVVIQDNLFLQDLNGLDNLASIVGNLDIIGNYNLPSLNRLENLTSIGGNFLIDDNRSLLTLKGIDNVNSIGGSISITGNDELIICHLSNLCTLLDQASSTNIMGNATACNSLTSIQNNCGNSVTCPTNITLGTQAQINKFSEMFPGCTDIQGDLLLDIHNLQGRNEDIISLGALSQITTINGHFVIDKSYPTNSDFLFSNLDGLQNLTQIGGNFQIVYPQGLTSLDGFEALTSVGGSFSMTNNILLEDISALSNLTEVGGFLLTDAPFLTSLNGLENLTQVTQADLSFGVMPGLENMQGLNNLKSIEGSFSITECLNITNFSGLDSVEVIGGDFYVERNTKLRNFEGFENLQVIGGVFLVGSATNTFINNDSLESFQGLEQLTSIGGAVVIADNHLLSSLSALQNLEFIGEDYVAIYQNPLLSECAIPAICSYPSVHPNGVFSFDDNATGCNSSTQVLDICNNSFSQVSGKTFADFDCDAILDPEDQPLPYHLIKKGELPFAFSDENANYEQFIPPFTTISYSADSLEGFSIVPSFHSVTSGNLVQQFTELDFAYCPDSLFHNIQVELTPVSPPRPGFSNQYQICVENLGTYTEDVILTFDWSNDTTGNFASILETAGGMLNGNTIQWNLNTLAPFTPMCLTIKVEMAVSTPLGTLLFPRAMVDELSSESNTLDNTSTFEQEVVGSYDPNDKTVLPETLITTDMINGAELEYLIRFQNTGTFPATFVEVIDTVEQNLDLSTLRMITASHPYTLSFPEERVIKWRFDDINLPDSTSNEPESHGFIKFSIQTIEGLTLSDSVRNRAAIYFDFNDPVITNYASTNIELPLAINDPTVTIPLNVFPNPANEMVHLKFTIDHATAGQIQILDIRGRKVLMQKEVFLTNGLNTHSLPLANLPKGVYFIQLKTSESQGIAKLMIH